MRGAEVYCGFGIAPEILEAAEPLRWVHTGTAGVGGSLHPAMRSSDVIFTNSAGIHGVPVAEHALAMMLYLARAFDRAVANRRERRWARRRIAGFDGPVRELTDATVAVIGYGGIGRELAKRARELGMRVLGVRRRPGVGTAEHAQRVVGPERLIEVLSEADYVVLCVPETPETEGLIGPDELGAMKPDAVLVNVSRGTIVDEAALIDALRAGRIRGAGLDVFREEPLPEDSPIWEMDQVCLTPHVAAVTPRYWERETDLILENTRRYLAGETMLNVVDVDAGY